MSISVFSLEDLNARLEGTRLYLDCPKCTSHGLVICFNTENPWARTTDDIKTMTVKPSYSSLLPCKAHFEILNGKIHLYD